MKFNIKRKEIIVASLLLVLIIIYLSLVLETEKRIPVDHIRQVHVLSENKGIDLKDYSTVFFLRFGDFSCHTCFLNFLNLSNFIRENKLKLGNKVTYLVERDDKSIELQSRIVSRFTKINSIPYHMYLTYNFDNYAFVNSSSVLIKQDDYYKIYEFPLNEKELENIKQELLND